MLVTRSFDSFYILICFFKFTVAAAEFMSGQSVTSSYCSYASLSLAVYKNLVPILLEVTDNLLFSNERKRENQRKTDQGSILGLFAYKADVLPTKLPRLKFGFQQCGYGRGRSMVPTKGKIPC